MPVSLSSGLAHLRARPRIPLLVMCFGVISLICISFRAPPRPTHPVIPLPPSPIYTLPGPTPAGTPMHTSTPHPTSPPPTHPSSTPKPAVSASRPPPPFAWPPRRALSSPSEWSQCEQRLGLGIVKRWRDAAVPFCVGTSARLVCRPSVIENIPPVTRPHTVCNGSNLLIDFAKASPANAPQHRAHYYLGGENEHFRYAPGFITGQCAATPAFRLDQLPADHLRDLVGAVQGTAEAPAYDRVVEHPVVLVTREGTEHRNVFHTMTDWINAYLTCLIAGVHPHDAQIVFLDSHPPAHMEPFWQRVFTPRHPIRRVPDFNKQRILFRHVLFSPPGYTSILFAHLHEENPCPGALDLLVSFADFVRGALGLPASDEFSSQRGTATDPIRITLVLRRLNKARTFMNRKFEKEDEIISVLSSLPNVVVHSLDLAELTVAEQVALMTRTDLFVGVHGAGLGHVVWLPPWAGLIEVFPPGNWRCYQNMAAWTGHWTTTFMATEIGQGSPHGSSVAVDIQAFRTAAQQAVNEIRTRKAAPT